ncbi:MAG TPA: hypothetical protein VJ483_08950, partial [Holophagaceae bacterium]|nr:hypothetical protein [Holophagaceae bacterium]
RRMADHPFLRMAPRVPNPASLVETARELGFFALALRDALDLLDRRLEGVPVQELGSVARAAARRHAPEVAEWATAGAFAPQSERLREAAFLLVGLATLSRRAEEQLGLLAALDVICARLAMALDPPGSETPSAAFAARFHLAIAAQELPEPMGEAAIAAVEEAFDLADQLLDHLFRILRDSLWVEEGA